MTELAYVGTELELFAQAHHWKRYWASHVRPYLGGNVLEVGAGIGSNTLLLRTTERRWVCLEPDPALAAGLAKRTEAAAVPGCEVRVGVLRSLAESEQFDAILYIDVLEHIEDDRGEVAVAAGHLRAGGHLVVLSPAHNWLFSPFDRSVGHHRRYTADSLARLAPPGLELRRCFYLDSLGMLASAANRWLLRQSNPTAGQLGFWDNWIVPISRRLDPLTGYRLGKSVLAVWKRHE